MDWIGYPNRSMLAHIDGKLFLGHQDCISALGSSAVTPKDGDVYCNATWDKILCWPPTKVGLTVHQHCPKLYGLDIQKYASRYCEERGRWAQKEPHMEYDPMRWTNFTSCYTPEAYKVYQTYMANKSPEDKQLLRDIVTGTRTLEIVGLLLSFLALLASLFIFTYFRSLRCHRTRIHRSLFLAILIHTVIRLIYYLDQLSARSEGGEVAGSAVASGMIFHTNVACQTLDTLKEFSHTVMFMWMLIEGLYLHNMIAVSVFSGKPNYILYHSIAWGAPLPFTIAWVAAMAMKHDHGCWDSYYYEPLIWVIEAPRIAVLVVNLVFYVNIIRILIAKLRNSYTNEEQQVRKALKAAVVLLPLLGITNFVVMIEPSESLRGFAAWSFISHFLLSFQGFFIALAYCFLNGEVRQTLYKRFERFRQRHFPNSGGRRRLSRSLSIFTSFTEVSHATVSQVQPQGKSRTQQACNGTAAPLIQTPTETNAERNTERMTERLESNF